MDGLGERHLAEWQVQSGRSQRAGKEVHCRRADEAGDEQIGGPLVKLVGRTDLLRNPAAHDHHPVTERHGLGLVVRHVDGRGAQPPLKPGDLATHLDPQFGIEVRQRLVHQESLGVTHDCPTHRHPLPLAAGQLRGLAVENVGQVKDSRGVLDLVRDLRFFHLRQG